MNNLNNEIKDIVQLKKAVKAHFNEPNKNNR